MVKVLGVDPGGVNSGYALLERGELLTCGAIVTKRRKGAVGDDARCTAELGRGLYPLVHRADLVVVEVPTGGFGDNAIAAVRTMGAAKLAAGLAWGAGRKVRLTVPVAWRSALGHKRGKDEQLHVDLARRFAFQLVDLRRGDLPHVLDAIGLALFGELVTTQDRRPT